MPTPRGTKILVAMSGGVDSSVAAALLVEQGYDVVGAFMRLGSPGERLDELIPVGEACDNTGNGNGLAGKPLKIGHQGCCSVGDAADARLVAAQLGVPLYVCNFKQDFGRIIDHFVDEYAAGRTPNPCVRCNDWLKFGKLHTYAAQIGATHVASGHHARVEVRGGEHALLRGADLGKDQSYVLFGAPRQRLAQMLLPVGSYTKAEVRAMARERRLPVSDKPDSQEICFVPDNDYAGLIERRRPELARDGAIVDETGERVGAHGGQHRFTIGQRRGVGVAFGRPVYVIGKDPESNVVTVGPRERLTTAAVEAGEANWLVDPPEPGAWRPALAQYRSNGAAAPARVRVLEDAVGETPSGRRGRFEVVFDEPQEAVAPGQAVVLYGVEAPERALGGGWVTGGSRVGS